MAVCTLESDLSRVPTSKFEKKWASGVQWYIINYNLRMTIENEVIAFELLFDGRSYGRVGHPQRISEMALMGIG